MHKVAIVAIILLRIVFEATAGCDLEGYSPCLGKLVDGYSPCGWATEANYCQLTPDNMAGYCTAKPLPQYTSILIPQAIGPCPQELQKP